MWICGEEGGGVLADAGLGEVRSGKGAELMPWCGLRKVLGCLREVDDVYVCGF